MEYEIPQIVINGHAYSIKEILEGLSDIGSEDPFVDEIISFCREWHGNKGNFTLFTSGSTGDPRPIDVSRQQMIASASQTNAFFNLQSNDRLLLCMNPKFIGGKMMLVRAFLGNMKIFAITPTSNPFDILNKSDRFDFTAFSPHQLYTILMAGEKIDILENMKAVIVGGAPVDPLLRKMAQNLKVPVYSTYGMTETVSHVALQRINGSEAVDFFEGIGDVEFGVNERGCLTIAGIVTDHRTLITNDLVELLSFKKFRWIGRVDNIINSGSIKIRIEELERKINKALTEIKIYNRFFIYPLPDNTLGQKVCMAIESHELGKQKVKEILSEVLDTYEKPKEIIILEKFVETPSGKIDRKKTLTLNNVYRCSG